jgi:hypothetical protein
VTPPAGVRGITVQSLLLPVLAAAAVLAPAVPAAAASPLPVTVSPGRVWPVAAPCTSGTGNHDFTVTGVGFQPGETVAVTVGGVPYPGFTADASGGYTRTFQVQSLPSGTYPVAVTGGAGSQALSSVYIGWSGCRSVKSGKLRMTGGGFAASGPVRLYLDGAATPLATATSDGTGRFDVTVTCPAGRHDAGVSDLQNRTLTFAAFTC